MDKALGHAVDLLSKFAAQLSQVAVKQAPHAWQVLCQITIIEAISYLVIGLFLLILATVILIVGRKLLSKGADDAFSMYPVKGAFACISFGTSLVLAIVSFSFLLNIWNYVAIFDPGLAIAHNLLNRLTGS